MTAPLSLEHLNTISLPAALQSLSGLYEHSPWVAERALAHRPWRSMAHLQYTLAQAVTDASEAEQLALIRAHPELTGRAAINPLTAESAYEQSSAGLQHCSPEEVAQLAQLNAEYKTRFGFPFVLAVRGPRGTGLSRSHIVATLTRRLQNHPAFERDEALRNIHRIAELRLSDLLGIHPHGGNALWDWHEALAHYSEASYAAVGQLCVTYLSDAHRACAQSIALWMHECGFDSVHTDAVGNVVGRYHAAQEGARYLLTGSHYDTVRNGGKYDGRLGIFVPMACVRDLHRAGRRLPFGIEVVAFAEEENQRYPVAFLGSGALVGSFNPAWLDLQDSDGITLRNAMEHAGLNPDHISTLRRDPAHYLGFVEIHIEQGPVLNELNLPLGIVSSINGSVRFMGELTGTASHAGTTPMGHRRDAVVGVAELALYVAQRAAQDADSVGTVGIVKVPNGSVNVVPGCCQFSLDLRAPSDEQRDALVHDVLAKLAHIATQRGLHYQLQETLRAPAAPCAPALKNLWENAVASTGLPVYTLASGAGHDAMKLHEAMPQAMLFVRGENHGISHNPLESTTSHDMQLAIDAFAHLLDQLAPSALVQPIAHIAPVTSLAHPAAKDTAPTTDAIHTAPICP